MRGLAKRLGICALSSVLGLTACAPKARSKQHYAVPEMTDVKLAQPCRLNSKGQPAQACKFVMKIYAVRVQ